MRARAVLARRSLRVRLTALLVVLLLVACAAVGLATSLALRSFLLSRLDQQLDLAGSRYATALEHSDQDADNAETATVGQSVGTLGARMINRTVTAAGVISEASSPIIVSARDRAVLSTLTPSPHNRTINFPDLGSYRIRVAAGADQDVLVTGLPKHPIDETLHHVILAELAVFLAVVVVVGAIGGLAVNLSFRPLELVARTAIRVSKLPLGSSESRVHERVPETDESTEVGQVAHAVNQMLDGIDAAFTERQRAEQRLRRFIADASHDLRTPLAVIRSHTELIERDAENLPEAVTNSLGRIDSAARRMGRLVDDLLLLARLDSGAALVAEPVDLSRVLLDEVSDARVASPDHRWLLDLPEEPVTISGDTDRLHQILGNLLTNARLHTPAGTTVTVALAQPSPDWVQLSVADDGPGIPQDLLPRVRERFVRGDTARTTARGGSGLGLAIVSAVVEAHGGTLDISSQPGATTVTIGLPV